MNLWRSQFPAFRQLDAQGTIYLDSAATTQKPQAVIDAVADHLASPQANVHRAGHKLGQTATEAFEQARRVVASWFGATGDQLIWTRGTTEAINLVAFGWAKQHLQPGDEILLTAAEHHANWVPWQQLQQHGIRLRIWPLELDGRLSLTRLEQLLGRRTRLLAVAHASNVLGTIQPIEKIAAMAHERGALVVVDAAQTAAHEPINFAELGADFLAVSAHKMYGPNGIGALIVTPERLQEISPMQFGGEMVATVGLRESAFQPPPIGLEAGTPAIGAAIGWHAAVAWLRHQDLEAIRKHEQHLITRLASALASMPSIQPLAPEGPRVPLISFTCREAHPYDVASILDEQGIAVRAGMHCAQPMYKALDMDGSIRASVAAYNSDADIDAFIEALTRTLELLS